MTAPAPAPAWPALMAAPMAAAYMNEPSVEAFRRRVGSVYPHPVNIEGRGQTWTRAALDRAIERLDPAAGARVSSLADDL